MKAKQLYMAKKQKEFSRKFWRRDIPIILTAGLVGAVTLFCASVKILNEILK